MTVEDDRWSGVAPGADGLPVAMTLDMPPYAPGDERARLVVFIHGFKGFKDWGSWGWMAERFADSGLAMLRLNLSHNGVEGDGQEFTRLDLFEKDTWGKRMSDIERVLDWLRSPEFPASERVDSSGLGLLGHSMGGGLAILSAARDEEVGAVATLASVASANRLDAAAREQMRADGHATYMNARTGQEMRVGLDLLEELEAEPGRFDIKLAAGDLASRRFRIIQGSEDPAVSVDEAEALRDAAGDEAEFSVYKGTAHTFGARHPPDAIPAEPFPQVVDELVAFFGEALRR